MKSGYRVDILMELTGTYAEYTSLKVPVDLPFAESLARDLQRQHSPGRIVKVPEGEVIEQWAA